MTSTDSSEQKQSTSDDLETEINRVNGTRKKSYYALHPRFNPVEIQNMMNKIGQQEVNHSLLQRQNDLNELEVDPQFMPQNGTITNLFQSSSDTTVVPGSCCTFGKLGVLHPERFRKKGNPWTGEDIQCILDGHLVHSVKIGRLGQDQMARTTQPSPTHSGIYSPCFLYDDKAILQLNYGVISIEFIIKMKTEGITVKKAHRSKLKNMHFMICLLPEHQRLRNGIVFRRFMDEASRFNNSEIRVRVRNGAVIHSHFQFKCGDSCHDFDS